MHEPLEDHALVPPADVAGVRYERRPARDPAGRPIEGLVHAWITLDRPEALNAYTTDMVRGLTLAFQRAGVERDVVAVVLTGAGTRSFCTGGDAKHYAQAYAGRPDEFRAYLRLFSDAITQILLTDKPVINRVNGMRLAGGNELGLACDLSVASDLAVFGQAGPRHGSAPVMGSTDFLPLLTGLERAMLSCTLCEPWSAYEALRYGLVSEVVPVLREGDTFVPNPLVVTDRWLDPATGRIVHGTRVDGEAAAAARTRLAEGTIDLAPLDAAVERLLASFVQTFPGCLAKTLEALRAHKLERWSRTKEGNRLWLAQNMMTEAKAGFRAFASGAKGRRTTDHAELRRRLAAGAAWDEDLFEAITP